MGILNKELEVKINGIRAIGADRVYVDVDSRFNVQQRYHVYIYLNKMGGLCRNP
jgi:hypothetical protein